MEQQQILREVAPMEAPGEIRDRETVVLSSSLPST